MNMEYEGGGKDRGHVEVEVGKVNVWKQKTTGGKEMDNVEVEEGGDRRAEHVEVEDLW